MGFYVEPLVSNEMYSEEEENSILQYIKQDLASVSNAFAEKQGEGVRNYDFYNNRQWTEEEVEAHFTQRRTPFVFNEIKHKVDHLVGVQTQTRLDIKLIGRERSDEPGAALLTHIIKWASQVNDLEYVETDVFRDGIIAKMGAAVVYWENDDITFGYPRVELIPFNEIYFDANARRRDMSDARWMARVSRIERLTAKEQYPEKAAVIDELTCRDYLGTKEVNQVPLRRTQDIGTYQYPGWNLQDKEVLEHIEYCEKVTINTYFIFDDISGKTVKYDVKDEAIDYYDGLVAGYGRDGISIVNDDGSYKVLFATETKSNIMQTIILEDTVISRELVSLSDFPWVLFFPYFNHGDYTSFVDVLISPQILINRSFSQWDYILGASHKNMMTVMESLLRRGFNLEDLRREVAKTAPVIPVLSHQAINSVPNNPVNPQIFQNIEFGITRMNDYAGGRNSMGLQENAAESGRAVIARAEQGGVAKLPLFDGLRLWRLQVAQRMVWYIQNYMSPRQILRLIGDDQDVQYVELDNNMLNTLKETKYDIIVDEAMKSESAKERNMQQVLQFAQVAQLPPEIATPLYLEYTAIPETKKEEIRGQLDFYQKYIQDKAAQAKQEKMKQTVIDTLTKQQMKDTMQYGEEIAKSSEDLKRQEKELVTRAQSVQKEKERAAQEVQENQLMQQLLMQQNAQQQVQEQVPFLQ